MKTRFVSLDVRVPSLEGVSSVLLELLSCGTSKHSTAHYPPQGSQRQYFEEKKMFHSFGFQPTGTDVIIFVPQK